MFDDMIAGFDDLLVIGKAAELGIGDWAPLVVGAPKIGRWQMFGNLFARTPDGVARLDRHPTMAVHPVTPMHEADVRRHLADQTALPVGLVDVLALQAGRGVEAPSWTGAKVLRFLAMSFALADFGDLESVEGQCLD